MEQEEICEILKEIIPELENKIREELKTEYEHRLNQIEKYYQGEIETLIEKQNQLKIQFEAKVNSLREAKEKDKDSEGLYKRVAMLESQRKNWCKLQIQYQATIQELTSLLSTLSSANQTIEMASSIENSLSNETSSNCNYNSNTLVHPPPKSGISVENICIPFKKDKSKKVIDENLSNESSMIDNSLSKYVNQKQNANENKSHYHSVLSPPKEESIEQSKRIFWDEGKKKQLLSLIKFN